MVRKKQKLTLVVDPRFSGGTSAAVAREIYALADICSLEVAAISSKLFKGNAVHPLLEKACEDTNTPLQWDPLVISSALVALHNPSFLKFNQTFDSQIICDRLFVVCHENFLRPDGPEGFDVAHCLDLIAGQTIARRKYLSPVSDWNRQCCEQWVQDHTSRWRLAPLDWTNICDFELVPATQRPLDRRGRHSRPGLEKFPPIADLVRMFPPTCNSVRMLGADSLLTGPFPAHWDLMSFGAERVDDFLGTIDFFIYYTHPFLQESFGRVIAEALAAGKVVITNAATGATFGNGVIAAEPHEIDEIVARLIADPGSYAAQVQRGHAALTKFGALAFRDRFNHLIANTAHQTTTPSSRMEMAYDFL